MRYYEENFAEAIAPMDANVYKFLKLAFRKGDPAGEGKPAITATARRNHGMLGGAVPDLLRDGDIVSEEDLSVYVSALERNGFFGPSSWYLNHSANAEYAKAARNDGYLDMPVLFLNARYDYVCRSLALQPGRELRDRPRARSRRWLRCALIPVSEQQIGHETVSLVTVGLSTKAGELRSFLARLHERTPANPSGELVRMTEWVEASLQRLQGELTAAGIAAALGERSSFRRSTISPRQSLRRSWVRPAASARWWLQVGRAALMARQL
jgi:hypothetical protein